jgi:hypothetical protein
MALPASAETDIGLSNHGIATAAILNMTRPIMRAAAKFLPFLRVVALTVAAFFWGLSAKGAIQFDVFVGYDSVIREASWFPVAIEVHNDGPSFNGIIELSSTQFGGEPDRRITVELPTNTRKRIVVPMFAAGGRQSGNWDARLLDANRKVRAERAGITVRSLSWQSMLLGALPRSFAGMPNLPKIKEGRTELQPAVTRFQAEYFPDNPIAIEGVDALYINSEKIIGLPAPQLEALLAWVRGGGHLILAVEQVTDVTSTDWLQQFLPVSLSGVQNRQVDQSLNSWLKSDVSQEEAEEQISGRVGRTRAFRNPDANMFYTTLEPDPLFSKAEMPVATGTLRDGRVLIGTQQAPLAVQTTRGRGRVTVLLFSPEREPFKSWKNRSYFWARMAGMPTQWFTAPDFSAYGSWSIDGVFGALIDSRQVKKLPVEWLLLLLLVYLIVIGPFDQWWLKKINRQMLTWITFPCYVIFFSLLIYFIGYKLRAGETEWNEVQVVDVYPRGDGADLRGRSFVSVYSSSNARYPVVGEANYSAVRPEFVDLYGSGRETKMSVEQTGNSFKAEVFVPVWTSLLFVNDWFKTEETRPLSGSVAQRGTGEWNVRVENPGAKPLKHVRVVVGGLIYELGSLEPGGKIEQNLNPSAGKPLDEFLQREGGSFKHAVERRRNPLGSDNADRLEKRPEVVTAASFFRMFDAPEQQQREIVGVPGLDMSAEIRRGDAVILAWIEGDILTKPINQFEPLRKRRDTMLRLVAPVKKI